MELSDAIAKYIFNHTKPPSTLIQELAEETELTFPNIAKMMCGPLVGHVLKFLISISKAKLVFEIGMFTGYSTLWMLEGLNESGKIITTELNEATAKIAKKYFERSGRADQIELHMHPAITTLEKIPLDTLDFIFMDADKENYLNYYELAITKLKQGGVMVINNALWGNEVLNPRDTTSKIIAEMNAHIVQDPHVDNFLLNIRDGINLLQKK